MCLLLLFMNDEAVGGLMKDKLELGAEAGVAGGPVGRDASAGTDALMHAEILSYSRSRGLFAGVNLKGVVIRPEDDLNQTVYNKGARELLSDDPAPTLAANNKSRLDDFRENRDRVERLRSFGGLRSRFLNLRITLIIRAR